LDTWWPELSDVVPANQRKAINALVTIVSRELWLERNARVFGKLATLPTELCRRIKAEFEQWKRGKLWKKRVTRRNHLVFLLLLVGECGGV
jgi:hypothetical protein